MEVVVANARRSQNFGDRRHERLLPRRKVLEPRSTWLSRLRLRLRPDNTMSSVLTRSVFRATRCTAARLRAQPAALGLQRLHTSLRRWDEAKLATAEPVPATPVQPAAVLEQLTEETKDEPTQDTSATMTTASAPDTQSTEVAEPETLETTTAETTTPETTATETASVEADSAAAFDAWTVS